MSETDSLLCLRDTNDFYSLPKRSLQLKICRHSHFSTRKHLDQVLICAILHRLDQIIKALCDHVVDQDDQISWSGACSNDIENPGAL